MLQARIPPRGRDAPNCIRNRARPTAGSTGQLRLLWTAHRKGCSSHTACLPPCGSVRAS